MSKTYPWSKQSLKILCKTENVSCSGTKAELTKRLKSHFNKLKENVQIAKGVYSPKKYFAGLSKKETETRIKEIKKNRTKSTKDPTAYQFTTDKGKETKTSRYTQAFYSKFPDSISLKEKSDATGVPLNILKQVYAKGVAAHRTGHRPGATPQQWGIARVHSFLMKGCTYYTADKSLVESAKKNSPKAVAWWNRQSNLCPH
jgi:hypothetical protein